jgi:hypothetical protein
MFIIVPAMLIMIVILVLVLIRILPLVSAHGRTLAFTRRRPLSELLGARRAAHHTTHDRGMATY